MVTKPPPEDDGFNDTQKSQLEEMIKSAVGGGAPQGDPTTKPAVKPLSDDEYENLPPAHQTRYVRDIVSEELAKISTAAKLDGLEKKLDEKGNPVKVPEEAPTVTTFWRRLLWGEDAKK